MTLNVLSNLALPFWKGRVRKVGKPRKEKLNKEIAFFLYSFLEKQRKFFSNEKNRYKPLQMAF